MMMNVGDDKSFNDGFGRGGISSTHYRVTYLSVGFLEILIALVLESSLAIPSQNIFITGLQIFGAFQRSSKIQRINSG